MDFWPRIKQLDSTWFKETKPASTPINRRADLVALACFSQHLRMVSLLLELAAWHLGAKLSNEGRPTWIRSLINGNWVNYSNSPTWMKNIIHIQHTFCWLSHISEGSPTKKDYGEINSGRYSLRDLIKFYQPPPLGLKLLADSSFCWLH